MTMEELECDIQNDLEELGDPINRYSYLIACADGCLPYPEEYRSDEYRIRECQANTWVYTDWEGDHFRFFADSESLIVKGALALLQELYTGRDRREMASYDCGLLGDPLFMEQFTREQRRGLAHIIERAKADA